jgi:hypothetical protein
MHLDDLRPLAAGSAIEPRPDAAPATALSGLCGSGIVLTLTGEIAARDLLPGMKIITRDSGAVVLRAITRHSIMTAPVLIRAGTLGQTRPGCDVLLPPEATVLLRDWRAQAMFGKPTALVPARSLIDGEFVTQQPFCVLQVCVPVFDRPHVLYVDGLEVGTPPV